MTDTNLQQILHQFTTKKVLIIGDVMVDEYVWGHVSRISPEAPVPVVSSSQREHRMGGAANVAINIKAMGAIPVICSVIGNDGTGEIFKKLLHQANMPGKGIIEAKDRPTTVKTRIIGNHQHLLRVDHEITDFLDRELEKRLLERISEILEEFKIDALIFQDYDKGVLTPAVIEKTTHMANKAGIKILVDPKKRSFQNYKNVALFKPNLKELTEGLNLNISKLDYQAIHTAIQPLHKKHRIQHIMVTLSEKGVFISSGKSYKVIPALERDIADVSGAGDTVISVAALGMASGLTAIQTAAIANLAGGLVCEKIGVVPIDPVLLISENFTFPED